MVAEFLFLVHTGAVGALCHGGRGHLQINAPAHVLGIGLAALAPPGVAGVTRFGVELAKHIDPTCTVELVEPGVFFGQEARIFQIAFPVLQVDFGDWRKEQKKYEAAALIQA